MTNDQRLRDTDQHLVGLILIRDEQIVRVEIVGTEEHRLRRCRDRDGKNSLAVAHGRTVGLRERSRSQSQGG